MTSLYYQREKNFYAKNVVKYLHTVSSNEIGYYTDKQNARRKKNRL